MNMQQQKKQWKHYYLKQQKKFKEKELKKKQKKKNCANTKLTLQKRQKKFPFYPTLYQRHYFICVLETLSL